MFHWKLLNKESKDYIKRQKVSLKEFTGISAPYGEAPEKGEIHFKNHSGLSVETNC